MPGQDNGASETLWKKDGIGKEKIPEFFERFRDKKYCMLIFLNNPRSIRPFEIDKTGFGTMPSWIVTGDVKELKKRVSTAY